MTRERDVHRHECHGQARVAHFPYHRIRRIATTRRHARRARTRRSSLKLTNHLYWARRHHMAVLAVLMVCCAFATTAKSQTAYGPVFWESQTSGFNTGPFATQQEAIAKWLSITRFTQGGPCGALGTSRYQDCPLSGTEGGMDVPAICPGNQLSPDGLTCPGDYFMSADAAPRYDCGCDQRTNNKMADPISPASGNVYEHETDTTAPGNAGIGAFERFYNSADLGMTDLSPGWRHSFSRQIIVSRQATPFAQYFSSYNRDSSLYSTPTSACTSGWAQVSAQLPQWANTTSSFANGVCSLSSGGIVVATVPVLNASQWPPSVSGTVVAFDAIRDNGQDVNFSLNGTTIVAPAGVSLRLMQIANGYQLIDDDDNVEIYNAGGMLVSVTTRAGIAETLTYDSSNRLSTVTDSFGHKLTLAYDSQNRLSSVTDPSSHTVQYGYDSLARLSTVINLDNTTRTYAYENTTFTNLLTGRTILNLGVQRPGSRLEQPRSRKRRCHYVRLQRKQHCNNH